MRRKIFAVSAGILATIVLLYVTIAGGAQSVTLAWNANVETNLAGYRLYWGQASRSYTNSMTVAVPAVTCTVTNLKSGRTYYFAVTAFTSDGLESDYSDEVFYLVPGERQPDPVTTLRIP